jgi:alpha-methylacyl-CoA racemase
MIGPSGAGPLHGVRVLDVSALGPGPFCSMILADFGAEVIAVERPGPTAQYDPAKFFSRGKRSVVVDLRSPRGPEVLADMAARCDVFLEGYRPGTMERRGLGPDVLLRRNPGLIYTRLTGYGQTGPYAQRAGHDINYIAVAGLLGVLGGEKSGPPIPLNILGDFASGSLMAALGTIMALFERFRTGWGQVVDAAMVDGAAMLLSAQLAEYSTGQWAGAGKGVLGGAAPYYGVYRCLDDKWFTVGAIETKFYDELLRALGLDADRLPDRDDPTNWDALRNEFAGVFRTKSQSHWAEVFSRFDACGAPVNSLDQLAEEPHLRQRGTVQNQTGWPAAAPAPRLSGFSPQPQPRAAPPGGRHTREVLTEFGWSSSDIDGLASDGTISV